MTHRSLVAVWFAVFAALALLALPFVGIARSAPTGVAPSPAAAPNQDVPPDWSRVDTGPFSVALPPGWRYEPKQGVDSVVGLFVGDGITLTFDLGGHWNSPPGDGSRHDVTRERIDHRAADIARPHEPADTIGLFIEHVDDFVSFRGPTHLSIVGQGVPSERHADVLALYRSVRFRRFLTDGGRWTSVDPPEGHTMLQDLDLVDGSRPWVVGNRQGDASTSSHDQGAKAFERTRDGWNEFRIRDPLRNSLDVGAVAGNWAKSRDGQVNQLHHFDPATGSWQLERTLDGNMLLTDVAVDASHRERGWAIGLHGVVRLSNGLSMVADGGWGSIEGYAIDILPRGPLPPAASPPDSEAMVVGAGQGAALFDGRRWQRMAWSSAGFEGTDVDLIGADEAWIVGSENRGDPSTGFRHRVGDTFTAVAAPGASIFWSIDMLSPAEGWAVGGFVNNLSPADLWRFRDGTWEALPSPCVCSLQAVQALPNGEALAVGHYIEGPGLRQSIVLHYVPAGAADPFATVPPNETPPGTAIPIAPDAVRLALPLLTRLQNNR